MGGANKNANKNERGKGRGEKDAGNIINFSDFSGINQAAGMDDADEVDREVEALLDQAYESEDEAEIARLVDRVLELRPDDPEALLLRADLTEDDGERLSILTGALDAVRTVLKQHGVEEEEYVEDALGLVYLALLQRMAFTLFAVGDDDAALQAVEELLRHDLEGDDSAKNLYYRILTERAEWSRILAEAMRDTNHQPGWAYSRLAAAFMLARDARGRATAAQMFWDALLMGPDIPFYMLGYLPEPEDEAEDADFTFAMLYADVWSTSRELLNWFSRGVILFGLLSGRFGEERDGMLEILDSLGGREEFDRMCAVIRDSDDTAIIETLAAHHCLAE